MLISCILSIAVWLTGIISPATYLTIPACHEFAGEPAMRVVNGVTHFTYLHRESNIENQIIYARISADNSVVYHEVDTDSIYYQPPQVPLNLPTIEIDGNTVNIFYSKENKLFKAVSVNGGSFTIAQMEVVSDVMPIVKKQDGVWSSLITPYDAFSDSTYHYFTNTDRSPNDTSVSFIGSDTITGALRSNSDIWIKQYGGGLNNGWPTFYGPVITAGTIHAAFNTPPMAQIFQGGYYENVPALNPDFDTIQWQILRQGILVGPPTYSPDRIMLVTVEGENYASWMGTIVEIVTDTMDVWTQYPPHAGEYLFRNRIAHYDTLWEPGPSGVCSDRINIVNSNLWIRGNFSGTQTWYSAGNIMINDDITLTGTPLGEEPSPESTDHVALVSRGKIIIQYGYKDPADSLRKKPNCDGNEPGNGVYIYASLYALRPDTAGNSRKDGCFTFEYQHPHPSVPAIMLSANSGLWDNIDLHRRHYPPTNENPWPGNIDLPFYNPLWPERLPYMERGTIHLFGSLYQQRRGFTHRNITDSDFPNPENIWDVEDDLCGGPSGVGVTDPVLGISMAGINPPNTSGNGVGYIKDYHKDASLDYSTFPFNPFGLGMRLEYSDDGDNWGAVYYKSMNERVEVKSLQIRNNSTAMLLNKHIAWRATPVSYPTEFDISFPASQKAVNMLLTNDNNLMFKVQCNAAEQDSVKLYKLNPETQAMQEHFSLHVRRSINSLYSLTDGEACFANLEADNRIRFYLPDVTGNMQLFSIWEPMIGELTSVELDVNKSKLVILSGNADSLYVLVCLASLNGTSYHLFYAKGVLDYTSNEDITEPQLCVNTKVYPNPFKQTLTLKIETNKNVKADVSVYNVKGQKVKTICPNSSLSKGEHSLYWDGTDNAKKTVSNGVYFLRGKIGTKPLFTKLLLLK